MAFVTHPLDKVLAEAERLQRTHRADWSTYEMLKNELHHAGVYGHEEELARKLGL